MRLITFIVAIFAASTPAGAQGWKEYEDPNDTFTAAFPAEPKVETTSYQASGGRLVEARIYSVVQEGGEFKVTSPIWRIPRRQKATLWPMRYSCSREGVR